MSKIAIIDIDNTEPNIRGLITLLGWGSLLKGICGIVFPETYYRIIDKLSLTPALRCLWAIIFLGIGCLLVFVGFVH
ncbi:MAG: hypothetical protein ABR903_06595 [Thermodesulfovibrionales bacterium]|jgi:hypothetical protein